MPIALTVGGVVCGDLSPQHQSNRIRIIRVDLRLVITCLSSSFAKSILSFVEEACCLFSDAATAQRKSKALSSRSGISS
ncbi:hypothetical protein TNIN_293881 [Trichonephila inaurata madagascariensis]|uniref:Uncharacterized protein n=1 Tax=Trichonephila inaurata madagascariensis TaxID=2747483 RepID=A0A8X6XGE0_9ARAC|nr:hypothetical protein TNIN_293881 [Trichonephila inaurata madagascariensis]